MQGSTDPSALGDWATGMGDKQLHAPPGAFWNYSNPNFSLAGRLVEVATGRSFNDVVVEDVWRPAGMETTFMLPSRVMSYGNYSYGHNLVDAMGNPVAPVAPDAYETFVLGPAGMAFSTPSDMVRWAKLLIDGGGDVLLPTSVAAMQDRQIFMGIVDPQWYGYGIFVEDVGDTRIYHHAGNVPGWSSQLYWVPEQDFAVSILANDFQSLNRSAGLRARRRHGARAATPGRLQHPAGDVGPLRGRLPRPGAHGSRARDARVTHQRHVASRARRRPGPGHELHHDALPCRQRHLPDRRDRGRPAGHRPDVLRPSRSG